MGSITDLGGEAAQLDTSPIDASYEEYLVGRRSGHINFNGFYNPGASPEGIARWLANFPSDGTKTVGLYATRGTVGSDAFFGEFQQFGCRVQEAANGALTLPVVLANGGSGPVYGKLAWVGTDASATVHAALDLGTSGASKTITDISVANPTVVTCVGHGLTTGDTITISSSNSTPVIDGQRAITRVNDDTFTVAVNVTVGGSAGTFQKTSRRYGLVLCCLLLALTSGSMVPTWEQSIDGSTGWAAITGSTMTGMTLANGVRYVQTSATQLTYRYVRVSSTDTFVGAQWVAAAARPASAYDA